MVIVMTTPNPMNETFPGPLKAVSSSVYVCAGIKTTVFGLKELPPDVVELACLWLLHPRLQTQACMAPIAGITIAEWNARVKQGRAGRVKRGLIAVSFDQRNHGSRLVDGLANEAWKDGNPRHAIDMYSIYGGTSLDLSHMLNHLPGYLFPELPVSKPRITANVALGVSLGGHAVWHSILHDRRVGAAVSVIGCPDYVSLISDRARLSKRPSYVSTSPPGSKFFGSEDFPPALVEEVRLTDPAALLMPLQNGGSEAGISGLRDAVSPAELQALRAKFDRHIKGKAVLCLSGGADRMVSPKYSELFLTYLKAATGRGGIYEDGGVVVEEIIYDGVGHKMTPEMVNKSKRWICDWLAGDLLPRTPSKL